VPRWLQNAVKPQEYESRPARGPRRVQGPPHGHIGFARADYCSIIGSNRFGQRVLSPIEIKEGYDPNVVLPIPGSPVMNTIRREPHATWAKSTAQLPQARNRGDHNRHWPYRNRSVWSSDDDAALLGRAMER